MQPKTILNTLYPTSSFDYSAQLEFEYHFQECKTYVNDWIEGWIHDILNHKPNEWEDKDALPFALYLRNNKNGSAWNSILLLTQMGNAIYGSNSISDQIITEDLYHVSEPLRKYGIEMGLPEQMVNLIIIWVWS